MMVEIEDKTDHFMCRRCGGIFSIWDCLEGYCLLCAGRMIREFEKRSAGAKGEVK
jgi:hypothetical protein